MEYTKGEWKVQKPYIDKPTQIVTVGKDGKLKEKIADVNWDFDAHLIAAAPELYEACKEAVEAYEGLNEVVRPAFWEKCKDAIAKVEVK